MTLGVGVGVGVGVAGGVGGGVTDGVSAGVSAGVGVVLGSSAEATDGTSPMNNMVASVADPQARRFMDQSSPPRCHPDTPLPL
ncbi:hypothetical protein GCM10009789_79970 [Kribbella sancticallisti]|uniref:Uncharacterized protein n=1 Tax=Kribbella sancticallisti TaxID=460087 RepID=A0ABN2EPK0_9ACTN